MNQKSLDNWLFLLGKWKGKPIEHEGDETEIISKYYFTKEDHENFILGRHISTDPNGIVNSSVSTLLLDKIHNLYIRKTVFSYGFINNETEYSSTDNKIVFSIKVEPNPPSFEGITWRSLQEKIDENKIIMTLMKRNEKEKKFTNYNVTKYVKIEDY